MVAVNGQLFYYARVPFETRMVGSLNLGQTANVLPMSESPVNYTRSALFGTNLCRFLNPAQATFGASKTDRGKVERIDLAISIPTPNLDSDGDGIPDWAEIIAGTDPHDSNSVFKLSANVRPSPQGGLTLEWSSISGRAYSVLCTTNLSIPFTPLATNILATGVITEFHDYTAIETGPFFYRIKLNQTNTP
jgi:hypothetical protein